MAVGVALLVRFRQVQCLRVADQRQTGLLRRVVGEEEVVAAEAVGLDVVRQPGDDVAAELEAAELAVLRILLVQEAAAFGGGT